MEIPEAREILADLILLAKDTETKTVLFKYEQEQHSDITYKNISKSTITSLRKTTIFLNRGEKEP